MAMTFGIVVHDKQLFWLGVKNNIISLMMCMIPGYVIGCIFMIWMTQWNPTPTGTLQTLLETIYLIHILQGFGRRLKCRVEALMKDSFMVC